MKAIDSGNTVIVFGLSETGLGVARSLGQKGIKVIGIDFRKDISWYSRYVKPLKCPNPLQQEKEFIEWIHTAFSDNKQQFPVFFTSDDFLISFSRNRKVLSKYFLFNLIDQPLFEGVSDKYTQHHIASKAGINLPATWLINKPSDLESLPANIHYPVFIKGQDVNTWRKVISSSIKGFLVNDIEELREKVTGIVNKCVTVILQEVIEGPDTNHFKYCSYTSLSGEILAEFTLQKIRQNPIHFGVGAVVESIHNSELIGLGRKLFTGINFKGIGSAEFKIDDRDGKFKLIEINPRYWQQNYLSTACGVNFPWINYLDLLNQPSEPVTSFISNIKWVNRYMDFDSFLKYRKEGTLSFIKWRKSLRGKKVYPDFNWADPLPFFYEFDYGKKLLKIPGYIYKRLFSK